jgi:hypothetical protein
MAASQFFNMESAQAPGVMVSSTFYDLKQHRNDLRRFIADDLGYRALLSEHPSFPIDPDLTTIENCRARVKQDADVLVLVIGRRYGSIDDRSARSVTNLEYLAAREKRIPIYAFIERGILAVVPVWRSNPDADFSSEVDTPMLFGFVEQVRTTDKAWVTEFSYASEIIDSLRIQFAYAHQRGLSLARRFRDSGEHRWRDDLRGETLRVALEQPPGWPFLLFAGGLKDSLAAHHRERRRHQLRIPFGLGEDVDDPVRWIGARFQDALRLPGVLTEIVDNQFPLAIGSASTPPDAEKLVFLFESIAAVYKDALMWSNRVRTANIHEAFRPVLIPLARLLDDIIPQIEQFADDLFERVNSAVRAIMAGEDQQIHMVLTITVPRGAVDDFNAKLNEAAEAYRRDA